MKATNTATIAALACMMTAFALCAWTIHTAPEVAEPMTRVTGELLFCVAGLCGFTGFGRHIRKTVKAWKSEPPKEETNP